MIQRAQMKSGGSKQQVIGISRESMEELNVLIGSFRRGSREFQAGMNVAAELLANATKGRIEKLYSGPQSNPADVRRGEGAGQAWTIPVRRITGKTQKGWRVKMVAFGAWEVYSEERGGFMVEFGIARGGGGKRRPILRISGNYVLNMARTTGLGRRIAKGTFGDLQMNHGNFGGYFGRLSGQARMMGG